MRTMLVTVMLGAGLSACGDADVESLGGEPSAAMPSWITTTVTGLYSPVVAVDSQGQLHVAGIDDVTGWPAFWVDGEIRAFPGGTDDGPALELSMVGGPDGMLHAVWTNGERLFYGRVAAQPSRSSAVVEIFRGSVYWPELAVSGEGQVFVAAVAGNQRLGNMRVETFRGTVEDGFRGPERVMPSCLRGCSGEAQQLHLSSVNYARGYVHLAMTVTDVEGTRTVLMTERRGWYMQTEIAGVSQIDAAGLTLSGRNESLLTVDETRRELRLHEVAASRTTQTTLHRLEWIQSARAARDANGILHVLVEGTVDERRVVDYLRIDGEGVELDRLATSTPELSLGLSTSTGALVVTSGGIVAALARPGRSRVSTVHLMSRRPGE